MRGRPESRAGNSSSAEALAVVEDYFTRVRAGDESVVDLFDDDAELRGLGFRKQGKAAIREFYSGILESAQPSPSPAGPLLADGNRVMAEIHIRIADGSLVHALDVFEVDEGKIRSLTYFTADYPRG